MAPMIAMSRAAMSSMRFDGGGVPGRAFAFHPAAQALQHGLGIERKVGGVHGDSLGFGVGCVRERDAYENDRRANL